MKTAKPILNYRQQKIKLIVQIEKENGYDLTKKELIDKIRYILDQDYQETQNLKEKELRETELKRVRKLLMDGKITSEEDEYVYHHHHDSSNQKQIVQSHEESVVLIGTFQRNPAHSHRNIKGNDDDYDDNRDSHVESNSERKEAKDENTDKEKKSNETDHDIIVNEALAQVTTQDWMSRNISLAIQEKNQENGTAEDNQQIQREKSELTLALEREESLQKLYELAEKMVFISGKK